MNFLRYADSGEIAHAFRLKVPTIGAKRRWHFYFTIIIARLGECALIVQVINRIIMCLGSLSSGK
jgi:hypothetical protein